MVENKPICKASEWGIYNCVRFLLNQSFGVTPNEIDEIMELLSDCDLLNTDWIKVRNELWKRTIKWSKTEKQEFEKWRENMTSEWHKYWIENKGKVYNPELKEFLDSKE